MTGMESQLAVRLLSDPAGVIEAPGAPQVFLAMHVGRSVTMTCERGGRLHRGVHVHGDIDIVPEGTPSVWVPEQRDTALIVSLQPDLLRTAAAEAGLPPVHAQIRNRFRIRDAQIEHIGWALMAEMEAGYPSGRTFTDALGSALAAALVRRHSVADSSTRPRNAAPLPGYALRQVLSYIEDNLAADLPLAELAVVCGMSPSHFKQMFRRTTGVPVHRYVIQRRVQKAQSMIVNTRLSIAEVAFATGFAHQSHLALHMRRILGCAPAELRAARASESA